MPYLLGGGIQIENILNKISITKGDGKYKLNLQAFFLCSMGINPNIEKMETELHRHGMHITMPQDIKSKQE